ncbi:MAG: carbon monoxide dehydrogenase subunit G [Polaribacter sp.]|jgi:carbon monoxide dehydrogenase subunit G
MQLAAKIFVSKNKEKIWDAITDIKNCATFITSIIDL